MPNINENTVDYVEQCTIPLNV